SIGVIERFHRLISFPLLAAARGCQLSQYRRPPSRASSDLLIELENFQDPLSVDVQIGCKRLLRIIAVRLIGIEAACVESMPRAGAAAHRRDVAADALGCVRDIQIPLRPLRAIDLEAWRIPADRGR